MPIPLPVPKFIQRKLDNGRAKLDACTPLVLLRRRLAEADIGCSPPSSDDRLSLPMLLERHGRWSTALMCGAVEEVAMGILVYRNGPVPIADGSLPKARIAAQKVALIACNLLLSKSTALVDRGVDAVQSVKETSLVLRKMSPVVSRSLPGVAVLRSVDRTFGDKEKANAAVRAFLDSRVSARVLRAHACFFDAAEGLIRWHRLLRVPQPHVQVQGKGKGRLRLRSALRTMPARAKLAMQRTWTAASVWALCGALAHASAVHMVLAIVMASDEFMDEMESVLEEHDLDQAKDGAAPALKLNAEVQEPEPTTRKQDADKPVVPAIESALVAGESKLEQEDKDTGESSDSESIKNARLKRLARPASFITSQGNKYRLKTQTGTQDEDPSSKRRRVTVKASLHGKGKGSKAKEGVLGLKVRVPAERLREGAQVVGDGSGGDGKAGPGVRTEDTASAFVSGPEVEALGLTITKEDEVPVREPIEDPIIEGLENLQPTRGDAGGAPAGEFGTKGKKSLGRGAAEAFGRLSLRLVSRAATMLPDAVVSAGSAVIVGGSSALGLDGALGLRAYYGWEEGPAVIGPWGSRGGWALVADNCPPPSPPAAKFDASAYASREETGGSDGLGSPNAVNTGGNASPDEGGVVEDGTRISDGVDVVSTDGVKKPTVVGSEVTANSIPKTSVESPAKVEAVCSDASGSQEAESKKHRETTSKNQPVSPFRLPLDRYPRPRLSWFALEAGLQSVRDVIKSVRGRGVDLWQDGVAGGEKKGAGGEEGVHLLKVHDQEKSESASPANGAQQGYGSPMGDEKCLLSSATNVEEGKAAQGAVSDSDGEIAGEVTRDEQAVEEELLEGGKGGSATERGEAGEEPKQDNTRQHDDSTSISSPSVPGGWVGSVNRYNGRDQAKVGGGSEMSRNFSNSSEATLVNTGTDSDRRGKTVDDGEKGDGALMSWLQYTRIMDLGDSLVGTGNVLNAQAKETRRYGSKDDADLMTPMLSEDGYMAESESFDGSGEDEKSSSDTSGVEGST